MNKKGNYTTTDYLCYKTAYKTAVELIHKNKRMGLLIMFGINTGLRYSDLVRLSDDDIKKAKDNNNELILIEKKTKKRRIIKLNSLTLESYDKFDKIGHLFISQKGSRFDISNVNRHLKKYFKTEKKQNISTHSLRKTFARTYYDNSEDKEHALIKLSEILNHSNIGYTRIYLGLTKEETNEVYDNLTKLIENE